CPGRSSRTAEFAACPTTCTDGCRRLGAATWAAGRRSGLPPSAAAGAAPDQPQLALSARGARSGYAGRRYSSIRRSPLPSSQWLGRRDREHRLAQAPATGDCRATVPPVRYALGEQTLTLRCGHIGPGTVRLDPQRVRNLKSRHLKVTRWTCMPVFASTSSPASKPSSAPWKC